MKPFDNVMVSATEPKNADIWVKHSKNLLRLNDYTESKSGLTLTVKNNVIKIIGSGSDTFYLDKIINFTDLANKIKGKTITLSSTDINYCSFTLATGQSPYFLQLGTLVDELRKKQTKEITEDLAYGSIYVSEKTSEQTIEFKLQIEFGDTATDWQEPFEDDILVNDNEVYNSVLLNLINPIKNRPYFTNSIYKDDGKIEINTNNGTYLVWIATSGGGNDPSLLLIDVQNESITSNGFGGMHNVPTYSNGKITITTKNQYLYYGYIQLR